MGRNAHGSDTHSTADQDKNLRVQHLVQKSTCRVEDSEHDEHAGEDIDSIVDADVLLAGAVRPTEVVEIANDVGRYVAPEVAVAVVLQVKEKVRCDISKQL